MSVKVLLKFCAGAEVRVAVPPGWKSSAGAYDMVADLIREAQGVNSGRLSLEARDHLATATGHLERGRLGLAAMAAGLVFKVAGQSELARQIAERIVREGNTRPA